MNALTGRLSEAYAEGRALSVDEAVAYAVE